MSCAPSASRSVASSRRRSSPSSSASIRTLRRFPAKTSSASRARRKRRSSGPSASRKSTGRGGISCFIVEQGTPGFTAKPFKVIRTSAVPTDVLFEDCSIPAENLVGQEGQGLELAFDLLVKQRFPYSACNLGVAVAAH